LYNILAYNAELAIAKNWGKIMRVNLQEIPENWQVDQWLSFARGMNAAFYDPFKEANKGSATGKIVGGLPSQAPIIDMEMGNTIQLYMNMMAYIKQELGEISGVSAARQGQIAQRAAVGNTEREVNQSSHITEYWFLEHDMVKIRVLECLLETAKYAWKNTKNKKIQYVLDDGATVMFELDGEQFNECDYGLLIVGANNSFEMLNTMKQLAHAGLQNGLLNFSQLLDIYSTESISSIRRKIQRSELDKSKAQERQEQAKLDMEKAKLEQVKQMAQEEKDFKREEWDREDLMEEKKLASQERIKEMEIAAKDNSAITLESLKLQAEKIKQDIAIKEKQLEETKRHNKAQEQKSSNKS